MFTFVGVEAFGVSLWKGFPLMVLEPELALSLLCEWVEAKK